MLEFNTGTIIFQLVAFLILVAILVFVIIGVVSLVKSNSNKRLEKQNEEILKQLAEIKETQEK